MNFGEFFREASNRHINIGMVEEKSEAQKTSLLSNEALFQLPLLAMVILALSKGNRKPPLSEIGYLVGECLERSLEGFKSSSQFIPWSANLRIRTVKALTFLETSRLAEINPLTQVICATERGKAVLDSVKLSDGNLAETVRLIERSYRNISAEAQIELTLL